MPNLVFQNETTAKDFVCLVEQDRNIHQPTGEQHGEYYGKLSQITPAVATTMISQGTNLLKRITTSTTPGDGKPAGGKPAAEKP